ncbi:hypothetical protein GY45DRAFT_1344224 [Cubamyces sp. BRFM 1775]|nr:hypothetical protein GY45DRAFT_1344224 [Cubamyces sp. BRFM 1775]
MAAVRPKLAVAPSGAVRAWSTVDSTAPSASTSFLDMRSSSPAGPSAPGPSAATTAKGKATAAPQPNVKKMRRRVALLTGVHLNLPSSPVTGPSPPGSSREMAWTFTAEWDSAHDEIVFSEVESGSSASSSSSSSSSHTHFIASPVPFDVDEDEIFDIDVLSAPPVTTAPSHFSDMQSGMQSSPSSSSGASSPSSPAVSDIFDFYTSTPSTLSFAHHGRNGSVSTAPSSPVGPLSPTEQSPPSYSDSRHDPPIISVTFYHETEDPARGGTNMHPGATVSAFDAYSFDFSSFQEKRVMSPPATGPNRPAISRRPLPPVPVRSSSMGAVLSGSGAQLRSVREDRSTVTRAMPSSYASPTPGPLHARAASLEYPGYGKTKGTSGTRPRENGAGKHSRSISAAHSGSSHPRHR